MALDPVRFLVADPLAGVQNFARQLLLGYGFAPDTVLCVGDTDAALAQGRLFKPDFLISDWFAKAPVNGLALAERLREVQPGLRLALLSFEVTPEHEAQARSHGAHFLLKKPFSADLLKTTLGRSLDALAQEAPELHRRLTAVMLAHQPKGELPRVALPVLPPQPVIKPGDSVRYKGERHVAQVVVMRQGEAAVQLKGMTTLIPVHKLDPG
jgi:CheY-like chemotaxis protein